MLRAQIESLRPFEDWLASERHRKAEEEAESKDLEAAALAQVDRPRQRWCIGSGEFKREGDTTAVNRRRKFASQIIGLREAPLGGLYVVGLTFMGK